MNMHVLEFVEICIIIIYTLDPLTSLNYDGRSLSLSHLVVSLSTQPSFHNYRGVVGLIIMVSA